MRLLQAALGKAGVAALATDGDYGRKTVGAVRAFQGQYGLMQTGSADPTTLALVYAKSGTPSDALLATGINATARTATIRSGASSAASAVQNVPAGAAMTILRSQNGWYHVSYKQRSGYLPADSVRIIDRPAPLINLSRAYGEGVYALTGDKKADLLGVAFTQLGFAGGSSSVQVLSGTGPGGPYSKYGAAYNDPGESYCSYFVSWSARKAGIDASIINDARDVDGVFTMHSTRLSTSAPHTHPGAGAKAKRCLPCGQGVLHPRGRRPHLPALGRRARHHHVLAHRHCV